MLRLLVASAIQWTYCSVYKATFALSALCIQPEFGYERESGV